METKYADEMELQENFHISGENFGPDGAPEAVYGAKALFERW